MDRNAGCTHRAAIVPIKGDRSSTGAENEAGLNACCSRVIGELLTDPRLFEPDREE